MRPSVIGLILYEGGDEGEVGRDALKKAKRSNDERVGVSRWGLDEGEYSMGKGDERAEV